MEPTLDDVRELARRSDPEFIAAFLRAVAKNFEYGEVGGEQDDRYWGWYGPKELLAAAVELLREYREFALAGLLDAAAQDARAVYFLGQLSDERAVPALTALVGNWDGLPHPRSSFDGRSPQVVAAGALKRIGPARAARLKSSGEFSELVKELMNPWVREPATVALGELLADPAMHDGATEALRRVFDPGLIGFLVFQVKRKIEREPEGALAATRVLTELSEASVVFPTLLSILRALGREAPPEFEASVERIGGPEAERALADHRAHRPEPLSYAERMRVLYDTDDPEAETAAYMKVVADARAKKNEETFAVHLSDLETSGDFEMLMEALRDSDVRTREAALGVVRGRRDSRFVAHLLNMLRDGVAREDRRGTDKVVRALKGIGGEAVGELVEGLKDDSAMVRWIVSDLLGEIAGSDSLDALTSLLNDPDEGVREQASVAIERIRSRSVEEEGTTDTQSEGQRELESLLAKLVRSEFSVGPAGLHMSKAARRIFEDVKSRPPGETFEALVEIFHDDSRKLKGVAQELLLAEVREHKEVLSDDHLISVYKGPPPHPSSFTRWYTHPETGAVSPEIRRQHERPPTPELLARSIYNEGEKRGLWRSQ